MFVMLHVMIIIQYECRVPYVRTTTTTTASTCTNYYY